MARRTKGDDVFASWPRSDREAIRELLRLTRIRRTSYMIQDIEKWARWHGIDRVQAASDCLTLILKYWGAYRSHWVRAAGWNGPNFDWLAEGGIERWMTTKELTEAATLRYGTRS